MAAGDIIRERRKELGLSGHELARLASYAYPSLAAALRAALRWDADSWP